MRGLRESRFSICSRFSMDVKNMYKNMCVYCVLGVPAIIFFTYIYIYIPQDRPKYLT